MAAEDYGRHPQPFHHFDRRGNSDFEDPEHRGAGRNFQTGAVQGTKTLKSGTESGGSTEY